MKKIYTALLALGFGIAMHAQAAFTVDLVTNSSNIQLGDDVLVQVQVSGLQKSAAPSLGDYDLNVHYDAGLFTVSNITWGDSIKGNQLDLSGTGGLYGSDSPSTGLLHFFQVSLDTAQDLDALQSDSFTLFSILLSSTATGSANFAVTSNAIGDAFGNSLIADISGGNKTVVVNDAVTPVPLPAALPLLLSALGMLGVLRRRQV